MKPISVAPTMTDQAYDAIVNDICDGTTPPGTHLIQEQLAKSLGVSRQPIQQAITRLKADGLVEDAPGRGVRVAELNPATMCRHYEIRSALDGLAVRLTARRIADSPGQADAVAKRGGAIIEAGLAAVSSGAIKRMLRCDQDFHHLFYEFSGNSLIAQTVQPHWRQLLRVMGEVLRCADSPTEIWAQHQQILNAVVAGDAARAELLSAGHIDGIVSSLSTGGLPNETNRVEERRRQRLRKPRSSVLTVRRNAGQGEIESRREQKASDRR